MALEFHYGLIGMRPDRLGLIVSSTEEMTAGPCSIQKIGSGRRAVLLSCFHGKDSSKVAAAEGGGLLTTVHTSNIGHRVADPVMIEPEGVRLRVMLGGS